MKAVGRASSAATYAFRLFYCVFHFYKTLPEGFYLGSSIRK